MSTETARSLERFAIRETAQANWPPVDSLENNWFSGHQAESGALLAQTNFLDDIGVTTGIGRLKILQQTTTLTDEHQ